MTDWFRRLLEPAPTSPTDSFRWRDPRPVGKQIANGFRIAGGLIAGFIVTAAAFGGLIGVAQGKVIQGLIMILPSALVMIVTANRWAPYVAVFFFGPAVLRIFGTVALEPSTYFSTHGMTRLELAEFGGYCILVIGLTLGFVGSHPAPTSLIDRFALTFFGFSALEQIVAAPHFPAWPLIFGGGALLAAWCSYRWTRRKHKRERRRPEVRPSLSKPL